MCLGFVRYQNLIGQVLSILTISKGRKKGHTYIHMICMYVFPESTFPP